MMTYCEIFITPYDECRQNNEIQKLIKILINFQTIP